MEDKRWSDMMAFRWRKVVQYFKLLKPNDALITSAINCITSFIAGFVVFSVLGHMSYVSGKSVDTVARDGKLNAGPT
jgi:hypothetical protein